ncbi:MAG: nucleotidyl transferase AbiEii/AbiGii toxin family protein [Chloroflexia bacterium]|nr:nucleotidyl transferase AbiEii/AbiGii toxin family protein [Chloroflexia bacterium]
MDISLNEPICAATEMMLDASHQLRVATIEDIVAEKLRALLQQPIRNRDRRQDLLDLAIVLSSDTELDRERVARFLIRKAAARRVPVSRAAFHDPDVLIRAERDYSALRTTTRHRFAPFVDADALLHAFVATLPIPEH